MALRSTVLFLSLTSLATASASAGDWFGWHRANHYGTCDACPQDVWEDMIEDVYRDGKLKKLYRDPCDLFHLGRGSWACPGCTRSPLHYHEIRPCVLTPETPWAGASWYRGVPVGHRDRTPLAGDIGEYDRSQTVP